MDDSQRQNVVEKINAAFPTASDAADSATSIDSSADGSLVEADLHSKHWNEITVAELLKQHDKLPIFSTAAYGFYLPAYLLGVIRHFDELDIYEVPARLIRSLAPPKDYQNRLSERVQHFTPPQNEAVYSFLLYYKTLYSEESWRYFPEEKQYLDAAIKFWENASK
jgi:hypothetical protein